MDTVYDTEEKRQFYFAHTKDKVQCCCGRIMIKNNFNSHKKNAYHLAHRTNFDESYVPTLIHNLPLKVYPLKV